MFLDSSRYAKVPTEEVTTPDGRRVTAVGLRPLPPTTGDLHLVIDNDRLDLLSHDHTGDGTRFWHVADANTALEARELTAVTGDSLVLPGA
jgi:hypothetical protein